MSIKDWEEKVFTPNYPEIMASRISNVTRLLSFTLGLRWRPGIRYIEYPDRKISIGSKYPTFTLTYTHAVKNVLGVILIIANGILEYSDNLNLNFGEVSGTHSEPEDLFVKSGAGAGFTFISTVTKYFLLMII